MAYEIIVNNPDVAIKITSEMDSAKVISAFIQGMQDCKDGKKHKNRGDSYNRGYSAQYQLEQIGV